MKSVLKPRMPRLPKLSLCPSVVGLSVIAVCCIPASGAAVAGDADGCHDLKLFTRNATCIIVECGSKHHDSVEFILEGEQKKIVEGGSQSVTYSCPASVKPEQIAKQFQSETKRVAFASIYEELEDADNMLITARRTETWAQLSATAEESSTTYSITLVETNISKGFNSETCSDPELFIFPKGCSVRECSAKKSDSVEMRTGADTQASLTGPIRSVAISCEQTVTPGQMFMTAQTGLKTGGHQVVFTDLQRADYSWLTAKSPSRWVELSSFQDDEAISYQLTGVRSGNSQGSAAPAAVKPPVEKPAVKEPVAKSPASPAAKPPKGPAVKGPAVKSPTDTRSDGESQTQSPEKPVRADVKESVKEPAKEPVPVVVQVASAARPEVDKPQPQPDTAQAKVPESVPPKPNRAENKEVAQVTAPSLPPNLANPRSPPAPAIESEKPGQAAITELVKQQIPAPAAPKPNGGPVIPPKPLKRVPMTVAEEVRKTLTGDVTINVIADVNEDGYVVKAVLAPGELSKDGSKLSSIALETMMLWRFKPATQNGRRVATQVMVPMKFINEPIRTNVPGFLH